MHRNYSIIGIANVAIKGDAKVLKNKVFEVMVRRGYKTRKSFADVIGMTPNNLGRIVSGDVRAIRLETLESLCRRLECQPSDLFEYVPDEQDEISASGKA